MNSLLAWLHSRSALEDLAPLGGGEEAYCFRTCEHGIPDGGKCGGADLVVCDPLTGETEKAFCRPICTTDDDCEDRFCDRKLGVCRTESNAGDSFGQACDPLASNTGCDGICLDISDEAGGVCSHRCRFGSAQLCSNVEDGHGFCTVASAMGSVGDTGFCSELCETDEDCSNDALSCVTLATAIQLSAGASGACSAD